jgi:hypothetical protein
MVRINPSLCAKCKGYKKLCGLPYCPLIERYKWQLKSIHLIKNRDLEAPTPPSILVGEHGYPRVNIYFTTAPGSSSPSLHDDPVTWARKKFSLRRIIALRSQTVSGLVKAKTMDPWELYEKEISLAAVSYKPVTAEILLEKQPKPSIVFDGTVKPVGPSSPAKKIVIEENPRIPRPIEKIMVDDLKSGEAVFYLYNEGVDIYTIIKAFTLGMTGQLRERRIVPTRWGITAVDTIIANSLLRKIRTYPLIDNVAVYHGNYIGNYYTIILLPQPYRAEWIEIWYPETPWVQGSRDPAIVKVYEDRIGVFDKMDGGFLAARTAVAEKLYNTKRQAAVLIIREVFPSYYAPVGNWQIRETVKNILVNPPVNKPSNFEELKATLANLIKYPIDLIVRDSKLLLMEYRQSRLGKWLT